MRQKRPLPGPSNFARSLARSLARGAAGLQACMLTFFFAFLDISIFSWQLKKSKDQQMHASTSGGCR